MTDKIVVLTTCGSVKEARKIARALVERRLAACVQVLPKIESTYWWQGAVEEAGEWLLIAKSRRDHFDALRAAIEELHAYEVPEIVALPIVDGAEKYLGWIDASL